MMPNIDSITPPSEAPTLEAVMSCYLRSINGGRVLGAFDQRLFSYSEQEAVAGSGKSGSTPSSPTEEDIGECQSSPAAGTPGAEADLQSTEVVSSLVQTENAEMPVLPKQGWIDPARALQLINEYFDEVSDEQLYVDLAESAPELIEYFGFPNPERSSH